LTAQLTASKEELTTAIEIDASVAVSAVDATDMPVDTRLLEALITQGERESAESAKPAMDSRRKYGPTIDGNSLWRVANNFATANRELSFYQWMYGIWKVNPLAFTHSNMHQLKVGELILVPLESEVKAISHAEAYRTYAEHMALMQPDTLSIETVFVTDAIVASTVPRMVGQAVTEEPPVTPALVLIDMVGNSTVADPSATASATELKQGDVVIDLIDTIIYPGPIRTYRRRNRV